MRVISFYCTVILPRRETLSGVLGMKGWKSILVPVLISVAPSTQCMEIGTESVSTQGEPHQVEHGDQS